MNSPWKDASRILCVRLDNLGDVLMTTPAIRALKALPGKPRHITLMGSSSGVEIARQVPEIDATLIYDAPWVAAGRDAPLKPDIVARLSAHRFDAVVIFTCYSQSALPAALMCSQAGIPLRLAHCRENPYALLTDWVRDPEPENGIRHEVERQLALVGTLGATTGDDRLSVRVVEAARERVQGLCRARGVDTDRGCVVIHPGASAASRRWPADRFGRVAAAIVQRFDLDVLVTGSAGEAERVAEVVAVARNAGGAPGRLHDLAGSLSLEELVAAIDDASLLISNNSGPVHIAAARDTPVVDLYALTNPQHTPWRVAQRVLSHAVPCANCQRSVCPERHHACLLGVPVDEVVEAASSLLDPTGPPALDDDAGWQPIDLTRVEARAHPPRSALPC